jgi:hypothetical protein
VSDEDLEGEEHPRYNLEMPFVVCASQGGPFDDDAFVAGYRCGVTDGILAGPHTSTLDGVAREAELKQLDLIAMRRGFVMTAERADEEWFALTFTRVATAER